jgi:biotin transport system substrate-specific component
MTRDTTLSAALLGPATIWKQAALVIGGSLLIALSAQVSVPMIPVPMTLQTLAVLLVGLVYGSRLGALTLLAYLAEGAAGLPVFANGSAGIAHLAGPTAGFLWGFVAMAWLAGYAVERGIARGFLPTAAVAIAVSALLYLPGVLWLAHATPLDLQGALKAGMLPFLLGDAVKAVIAALVVSGGWAALRARRG